MTYEMRDGRWDQISNQLYHLLSLFFLFIFNLCISTMDQPLRCNLSYISLLPWWYDIKTILWYEMINQPSLISYLTLIKTGKFNRFFPSHSSNGVKKLNLWDESEISTLTSDPSWGGDWKIDVSPYKNDMRWDEIWSYQITKYPSLIFINHFYQSTPYRSH